MTNSKYQITQMSRSKNRKRRRSGRVFKAMKLRRTTPVKIGGVWYVANAKWFTTTMSFKMSYYEYIKRFWKNDDLHDLIDIYDIPAVVVGKEQGKRQGIRVREDFWLRNKHILCLYAKQIGEEKFNNEIIKLRERAKTPVQYGEMVFDWLSNIVDTFEVEE